MAPEEPAGRRQACKVGSPPAPATCTEYRPQCRQPPAGGPPPPRAPNTVHSVDSRRQEARPGRGRPERPGHHGVSGGRRGLGGIMAPEEPAGLQHFASYATATWRAPGHGPEPPGLLGQTTPGRTAS